MKNMQSKIKPLKVGKQSRTMYCFGCKDYTKNFRPEKVKMTNKVLKNLIVLFVDLINQDFQNKKEINNFIIIRWRLIA